MSYISFQGINSGLNSYFFGENREGILTVEKFLEFQRQLQNEILRLEFNRKLPANSNTISEKDFADLLIAYAGFPAKKKAKMLKRVKKTFHDDVTGITLEDFLNFYQVKPVTVPKNGQNTKKIAQARHHIF